VKLNLKAVEERVSPLGGRESYDREFIFDLLLAYGRSKGNVTRLRNGSLNVADDTTTDVAKKNVIYFHETAGDPLEALETLRSSPESPRGWLPYKTIPMACLGNADKRSCTASAWIQLVNRTEETSSAST